MTRPSLPDAWRQPVLAPFAALAVFVIVASSFAIRSTDVFWHLAAGRWMVEHYQLPVHDPFRFTSGGRPWIDHEWLFQLIVYGVEWLGGLAGLVVFRVVTVLTLTALLVVALRRMGNSVPTTVLVVLIAVLGARPRFILRPELFTFVALTLELLLLRRFREGPGATAAGNPERVAPRRALLALLVLTVVWANLHGLALLSPLVAGAYLLGLAVQGPPAERHRRLGYAAGVPALLALALLANPYGARIFWVPVGITGAMRDLVGFNPEWLPLWLAPQPFLLAGYFALAALVAGGWWRARLLDGPTGLVVLGLGALAVTAVRHQALFFVSGAFLAGETLPLLWKVGASVPLPSPAAPARTPRVRLPALAIFACLAAAWWSLMPPSSGPLRPRQGVFAPGLGIEPGRFPEQAADFIAAQAARGRAIGPLYNELAHGGYLLWRLYPRQVFHDGRMELEPDLLREIGQARRGNVDWDTFLARRGAVGALVRYDERLRPVLAGDAKTGQLVEVERRTSNALLFPRQRYALVYWDDLVMLFLDRTIPASAPLLTDEYAVIEPEDLAWTLRQAAGSDVFAVAAAADVARKLGQDPACQRATRLATALSSLPAGNVPPPSVD